MTTFMQNAKKLVQQRHRMQLHRMQLQLLSYKMLKDNGIEVHRSTDPNVNLMPFT